MLLKINLVVIVFLLVVLVFFILVLKIFRILVLRVKLFLFDEFSVYGLVWCDMKSFVLYNFKNVKIFFLIYFW